MTALRCAVALAFLVPLARAETPAPEEIVARADEIRNPQADYIVEARVASLRPGEETKEAVYEVWIKGRDASVIRTLAPATDRGTSLLMRGRDMWAFLSNVAQPVRISLQQRLLGEVANGDLARVNFSGDYAPRILKRTKDHYLLKLTARYDNLTYNTIELLVSRIDFRPLRADFFALSGRLLKQCSYEGYGEFGGRERPTLQVYHNPLVKGQKSAVQFSNLRVKDLPAKLFTKAYMKRLAP